VHGVTHLGVVTTRVDVHVVSEASQGARKLADVDVHSSAVSRSGLGEGRRVIRKDGESSHGGILPALTLIQRGNCLMGRLWMDDVDHVTDVHQSEFTRIGRRRGVVAAQVELTPHPLDATLQ